MKSFLKYVGLALLAVIVVLVGLRLFVLDLATISGDDMLPALGENAWIVVHRRAEPRRGDLIMFQAPDGKWHVRRVIALPGEKIAIVGSRPKIPGKEATHVEVGEISIKNRKFKVIRETLEGRSWEILDDTIRRITDVDELDVHEGYFVLADHREHAKDSREYKAIPRSRVRGVVWRVLDRGDRPR